MQSETSHGNQLRERSRNPSPGSLKQGRVREPEASKQLLKGLMLTVGKTRLLNYDSVTSQCCSFHNICTLMINGNKGIKSKFLHITTIFTCDNLYIWCLGNFCGTRHLFDNDYLSSDGFSILVAG